MERYLDPKTGKKAFTIDDDGKVDIDLEWLDSKERKAKKDTKCKCGKCTGITDTDEFYKESNG